MEGIIFLRWSIPSELLWLVAPHEANVYLFLLLSSGVFKCSTSSPSKVICSFFFNQTNVPRFQLQKMWYNEHPLPSLSEANSSFGNVWKHMNKYIYKKISLLWLSLYVPLATRWRWRSFMIKHSAFKIKSLQHSVSNPNATCLKLWGDSSSH